jgi:hypothetical protein
VPQVSPSAKPTNGLLDWLRVNAPDTYAALAKAPHDADKLRDHKSSQQRRKRRVTSPLDLSTERAKRPT